MTKFVTLTRDSSTGVRIMAGASFADNGSCHSWWRIEIAPHNLIAKADVERLVIALQNAPSQAERLQTDAIRALGGDQRMNLLITSDKAHHCPHCACFDRKKLLYRVITPRGQVLRCHSCNGEWTDRTTVLPGPFKTQEEATAAGIICEGDRVLARVYPWKCIVHRYGECDPGTDSLDYYKPQ